MPSPDPRPKRTTPSDPPGGTSRGSDTEPTAPAGPPRGGPAAIAGYRVVGELGRGGMGVVYRAEDPHLRREVALKVMLPQFAANPQAKARFLREARAQAKVEHDHVAVIHHIGEHAGVPFLVMPLLKGTSLQEALRAKPRPPLTEAVRIAREVAEGLAAAHEKGLVHRDIKPANVWLESNKLRVKVLDFGLARAAADAETANSDGPVTSEGALLGTPLYMSPEQARGLAVDARTDLWSLGVVLYQMTVGELPFRGKNTLAILTALGTENPAPPHDLNPAVPPALSALILRLLAKDPAGRPASAEAVVEELRQIELGLAAGVRVVALDSLAGPIAPAGPDPFAELDATELNTVMKSAARPARAAAVKPRGSASVPLWAVAAAAGLVVVAGLVWVAVKQVGNKPAEVAQQEPPAPPRKDPPAVTPKPKDRVPSPPVAPDDRKAAEGLRPHARLTLRLASGEVRQALPADPLPADPFEVTGIALDDAPLDPAFVANVVLPNVARLRSLEQFEEDLWLRWTDDELARFAGGPFRDRLRYLKTGFELTPQAAASLKQFPRLTGIGCRAARTDDEALVNLAEHRELVDLELRELGKSGKVTERGWAAVATLPLASLWLNQARFNHRACELIGGIPSLLDLRLGECGTLGEAEVKGLARARKVWYLSLYWCGVPDDALAPLAGMTGLTHLDLQGCEVTDAGLAALKAVRGLRVLNVNDTWVTGAGMKALQQLLPRCAVLLNWTTFEPADAHWREANRLLTHGGHFVTVQLPTGPHTAANPDQLPAEPFTVIAIENVANYPFGDENLKRVAELRTLRRLVEEGSQLTDAGLKHLAPLTELTLLNIGRTTVTDAGLKHLAGLTELGTLVLDGTAVSDGGVDTLAGLNKLTKLQIKGTRITEAGLAKLRAALPGCKIEWEPPTYGLRFAPKDVVEVPGLKLPLEGSYTVEAFVTPAVDRAPRWPAVLDSPGGFIAVTDKGWRWYTFHGHVDGPLPVAARTHVAGVRTPTERRLYVNGKLVAKSNDVSVNPDKTESPFRIGGGEFAGAVREVRVSKVARYDKDFTPAERHEPDKDTLALYHCDGGEGDTLKDASGNNHHGKITGAKWVGGDVAPKKP